MPKGPKGEKRPADVIGAAVMVAKIATEEIAEELPKTRRSEGGKVGGIQRAKALSPEKRREIAKNGAKARWAKPK
jgi:hypothetical protein